jgi:hypothetical protein
MNRVIKTRTREREAAMSGNTQRMARWVVATAVTAASLFAVAGSAQAFDTGTCQQFFGSSSTNVDTVQVDTGTFGQVDFGDHNHWFGKPLGTAVVCWGPNGRVHVRGQLFADSPENVCVSAQFRFFRYQTTLTKTRTAALCGKDAASGLVYITEGNDAARFNGVRIKLFGPNGLEYDQDQTR